MTSHATSSGPLELEPIDEPSSTDSAPHPDDGEVAATRIAEERASREAAANFRATAASELESGWIDRPLWESVLAQSAGDQALAKVAYLKTRATILQLEKRDAHAQASSPRARPAPVSDAPRTQHHIDRDHDRVGANRAWSMLDIKTLGIGALAAVFVAVGAWLLMRDGDTVPAPQASVAATAAIAGRAGAVAQPTKATPESSAAAAAAIVAANEALKARIAKLKEAGNWNVVVLLSSEWTRREPANVTAWTQLSEGYLNLGQAAEALDAATKVTQLAPFDPQAWRSLGQVELGIDRHAEALAAFEHAVSVDAHDVTSLNYVGMLNAQSAHLPEAKAAFDQVLSANPDDTDGLCGQAFVARRMGQPKDADALDKRLQSLNQVCQGWSESAAAAKVASNPAAYRRVPSNAR